MWLPLLLQTCICVCTATCGHYYTVKYAAVLMYTLQTLACFLMNGSLEWLWANLQALHCDLLCNFECSMSSDMTLCLQVRRRLRSAVMKSHSTEGDILVRAVASAFFDSEHGLQACAKGYLMAPVSYSVVAWYIRRDTDLKFADDFDNWHANEDDAMIEQDSLRNLAANQQDEANGTPDLTSLLDNKHDCKRFFTVLRSQDSIQQTPQQLQPYVIADLQALIEGSQLQKVQDVLSQVQYLTVHPEDPAYQTEFNRLKTIS